MKFYLICVSLAVAVGAFPEAPASGPYAPSGWRPSGRLLVLPARQQTSQVYGPPPSEYGPPPPPTQEYGPPPSPPPQEYGPPQTTEAAPTTTEAVPTDEPTEETTEDASDAPEQSERLVDTGVYYVLQPDGNLQRIFFTTAPLKSQKKVQQKKFQKQQKFQGNQFDEASSNFESQRIQQQKQVQLSQVQAHQAQFQPQSSQFNQQTARINQQLPRLDQQPVQFNQHSAQLNQHSQPFHYVEIQKSQEIEVAQPDPEQPATGFVANIQYRDVEPISAPVFAFNPNPLVRILK